MEKIKLSHDMVIHEFETKRTNFYIVWLPNEFQFTEHLFNRPYSNILSKEFQFPDNIIKRFNKAQYTKEDDFKLLTDATLHELGVLPENFLFKYRFKYPDPEKPTCV
jgi:hypothetical protein